MNVYVPVFQCCISSSSLQDGKQHVEYLPEQRGLHRLEVTYEARHVANSPYSLAVVGVEDDEAADSREQAEVRLPTKL